MKKPENQVLTKSKKRMRLGYWKIFLHHHQSKKNIVHRRDASRTLLLVLSECRRKWVRDKDRERERESDRERATERDALAGGGRR